MIPNRDQHLIFHMFIKGILPRYFPYKFYLSQGFKDAGDWKSVLCSFTAFNLFYRAVLYIFISGLNILKASLKSIKLIELDSFSLICNMWEVPKYQLTTNKNVWLHFQCLSWCTPSGYSLKQPNNLHWLVICWCKASVMGLCSWVHGS